MSRNKHARPLDRHDAARIRPESGNHCAVRAGVAKQTVYRWWPSKVDILLETLIDDASRALAIPDTGSAVERARVETSRRLARFLTKDPAEQGAAATTQRSR